jgi:hypothetical protein
MFHTISYLHSTWMIWVDHQHRELTLLPGSRMPHSRCEQSTVYFLSADWREMSKETMPFTCPYPQMESSHRSSLKPVLGRKLQSFRLRIKLTVNSISGTRMIPVCEIEHIGHQLEICAEVKPSGPQTHERSLSLNIPSVYGIVISNISSNRL